MSNHFTYEIPPLGEMTVAEENGFITAVRFGRTAEKGEYKPSALTDKVEAELAKYLAGTKKDFSGIPLKPSGTPFQLKVWEELKKIPYGETHTYGQIAEALGQRGASRAVGNANNKNPIIILVPCHRVLGSGGKLTGYAGGLDKKKILLETEEKNK